MPAKRHNFHHGERGAALAIRVTPRANKNEISGILGDGTVKIRLTAPPVDGRANEALADFLAQVLKVPVSKIEIIGGQTGRDKLVSILDLEPEEVQARLQKYMG
jgi:uncharacterized protein (TIGR00251 family)